MKWDARILRRLRLRDLDTFVAVAQRGSMVKAAAQLAVSQPAVSSAIADIERILGVRLFDRLAQGVELTLYGRALYKAAVSVFDDVRQGVDEIANLIDPTIGAVRIGTTEPMIAGILPVVLSRLNLQYPGIAVQVISVSSGTEHARELRERRFDVFLGRLTDVSNEQDLATEILFDEPLFVTAGAQNPLTRRRKISLGELAKEPWVLPAPETVLGRFLADVFKSHGSEPPSVAVVSNSIHMQHRLLTNGRFLTLFPRSVLHFSAKTLSTKVLSIGLTAPAAMPVGIVTLKNRTISAAARALTQAIREAAKPLKKGT